ncbi:MAG: hypothetical protein JKY65_07320 [Planctomycetes bacterium]|nr:hypothetical protein [Planctomycetota bacterium]
MNRKHTLLSLVFGLGCASVASAVDPRLPMLDEEPTAREKVDRFEKAYADSEHVLSALSKANEASPREQIHQALLSIPSYAKAYATYERTPDETAGWEAISRDEDQDLFVRAHATYFLGRALLAQDDLAGAAEALEAVRGRLRAGTPWTDEATLYLAYVHARLAEFKTSDASSEQSRARARTLLTTLSGDSALFVDAPERVTEGADWLLRELRGDGMGPLLELAKRMETIERLIRRSKTGKGTQKRQEQVVVAIDKLIEMMREKEKKGGGGACKKPGAPKPGAKKPGSPKGQKKGGAKESKLPGGVSPEGDLAEGPRRADQDAWSELKPKERERAAQFLKERFPSRYRELIERYYRGVAELDQDER